VLRPRRRVGTRQHRRFGRARRRLTRLPQPVLLKACDRKRRTSKLDVELAISSARLVKLRDLVSFARTIPAEVKAVPDWAVGGALAEKSSATTYEPPLAVLEWRGVASRDR